MLYIDSVLGYLRVLSSQKRVRGIVILQLHGKLQPNSSRYSIQIDEHNHLHPFLLDDLSMQQQVWPFLNHSCSPNSRVDTNTFQLLAIKEIGTEEEITFDYESTESIISESFLCNCKKSNCRGFIKGKFKVISNGDNFR